MLFCKLIKDLRRAESTMTACLNGASTPNGIKDLPDIFWLLGWFDWEMERRLILDEIGRY